MISFVKMHGIGNDYVYLDVVSDPGLERRFEGEAGRGLVQGMSDRHRGIGSDGVILVAGASAGVRAHVRMRMFNSDGSESEMCGNGVRCVAKFAHDRLGVNARPMRVETGRGVLEIEYKADAGRLTEATVDMGEPVFELASIPVDEGAVSRDGREHQVVIETPGRRWAAVCVSMGNPHAVIFENGPEEFSEAALRELPLDKVGPQFERHAAFPRLVNAHFASVQGRREVTMRTWERGAGITQACGTGACAVAAAGIRTGRLDRDVLVHLPGGDLRVRWDERTDHILMTGPATDAFEGVWPE